MKSNLLFAVVFMAGLTVASLGQAAPSARQTEYLEKAAQECKANRVEGEALNVRKNLIWDEALQTQGKADTAIGLEVAKIPGIETFMRNYRIEIASKELQVYEEGLISIPDEGFMKLSVFLKKKRVLVESLLYSKGARKNSWLGRQCGIGEFDLGSKLKFPNSPQFIQSDVLTVLGLSNVKTAKSVECLNAIDSAIEMLEPSNSVSIRQRLMQAKTVRKTNLLNKAWPTSWIGSFAASAVEKCRAPIACSDVAIVEKLNAATNMEKTNLVLAQTLRLAVNTLEEQERALDAKFRSLRDNVQRILEDSTTSATAKHACLENE